MRDKKWVPWGLPKPVEHTIDPETGIWPIAEWGLECGRGFVSNARFGRGDKVIERTNREKTRQSRELVEKERSTWLTKK